MKNTLALTTVLLLSASIGSAQALQQNLKSPDYKDYFSITGATILTLSSQDNVKATQTDAANFIISDLNYQISNDGRALLTVTNSQATCDLIITDGAYQMNPVIQSVICNNPALQYSGMDHSYGTYSYTLKFN